MIEPSEDVCRAVDALARMARMLERTVPGMTLADFRVLSAVAGGEARASRLSHRLAVGKPSISAAVDSLVRRGMLQRRPHAADQRAIDLTVTAAGADALARARDALAGLVTAVVAHTADPDATVRTLAGMDTAVEAFRAEYVAARRAGRTAAPHAPERSAHA